MEEVEDYNIFNQEGRLAATLGGEMILRTESVYPIATYAKLERDPMEALLTTISALKTKDGVAVQIMLRPASPNWTHRIPRKSPTESARVAEVWASQLQIWLPLLSSPRRNGAKRSGSGWAHSRPSAQRIEHRRAAVFFTLLDAWNSRELPRKLHRGPELTAHTEFSEEVNATPWDSAASVFLFVPDTPANTCAPADNDCRLKGRTLGPTAAVP